MQSELIENPFGTPFQNFRLIFSPSFSLVDIDFIIPWVDFLSYRKHFALFSQEGKYYWLKSAGKSRFVEKLYSINRLGFSYN